MTPEEFSQLERGDIIRCSGSGDSWLVDRNAGNYVTVVRTIDATNPAEWELAVKSIHLPAG